jgi:hypothetical protein
MYPALVAGAVGIEPTQAVLETAVLPLYDAPTINAGRSLSYYSKPRVGREVGAT